MKSHSSIRKTPYLTVFVVAVILTITSGWLLTNFLGRVAEKEFKEKVDREANLTASTLHENLGDVENAAKALNQAEQLVAALSSGSPADLERANKLLDRVNSSLKLSVCYLLDRNGLAVASSNRNGKNSFVGKTFAFRPFFTGAVAGRLTTDFALGLITRERGYFAATPVVDSSGAITGVVVVKRNVAPVEEFFKKYSHVYLVSPEGIIFVSSKEEFLYRSLWPVDEKQRVELLASQQFGSIKFEPPLAAEPRTGTYVSFENEKHYLLRLPFGSDGWTLVLLDDPSTVSNYRLFGIVLTIVFVFLLLLFFNVLLYKNRSLESARDLLKSRDDWKRTFDTVPDLIAIIDGDYRITSVNVAMERRLGMPGNAAVGRRCYELLHCAHESSDSCPHRRMLESGRAESGCRFEKNLNGDFIISAAPLLAEDGTIEASILVMHDVSDLKRMEQSLKEYAQQLEFVLEGSNDATWEWDMIADQAILNTRYYEMLEYTPEEMRSTISFFMTTIHPDDVSKVQQRMQDNRDGKNSVYEAHYRMITKSGKLRHVMARGKVVRYDEGGRPTKMAGVVTDVTEMKRLSEEVNTIHNLESIGLLAGGLAHDFNNVLNIIYGNITFAKMLIEGNKAVLEPLTDAEEACERAKELGIRLQAFSQVSSPVKEPIALPAIIGDAAGTLFKDSNISHTISAADDILPVEADSRQIRQMIENILSNAKEALSDGGTVRIGIENYVVDGKKGLSLRSGPYVCISIQDDGSGIPEGNLTKIFDPYFSTKDTYSQRGMGLGLSICHAIMKRHRGQISVESTVGIGTKVTAYLPASVVKTTLALEE